MEKVQRSVRVSGQVGDDVVLACQTDDQWQVAKD